jgi:hypothetical protein
LASNPFEVADKPRKLSAMLTTFFRMNKTSALLVVILEIVVVLDCCKTFLYGVSAIRFRLARGYSRTKFWSLWPKALLDAFSMSIAACFGCLGMNIYRVVGKGQTSIML